MLFTLLMSFSIRQEKWRSLSSLCQVRKVKQFIDDTADGKYYHDSPFFIVSFQLSSLSLHPSIHPRASLSLSLFLRLSFCFSGELILAGLFPMSLCWLCDCNHPTQLPWWQVECILAPSANLTPHLMTSAKLWRVCEDVSLCVCVRVCVQVCLNYVTDFYPFPKGHVCQKHTVISAVWGLLHQKNEEYQQIQFTQVSICQHPLLRGARFVGERRFYERCLTRRLGISCRTSLRGAEDALACVGAICFDRLREVFDSQVPFSPSKKGNWMASALRVIRAWLTGWVAAEKNEKIKIHTVYPLEYIPPSSAGFSQLREWQLLCTVWQVLE